MKNRLGLVAFAFSAGIFLVPWRDYAPAVQAAASQMAVTFEAPLPRRLTVPSNGPVTSVEAAVAIVRLEAVRMATKVDDPARAERRLKAFALSLSKPQAEALIGLAADEDENEDVRFAALQLSAWSTWDGFLEQKGEAFVAFAVRESARPSIFTDVMGGLANEALLELPAALSGAALVRTAENAGSSFVSDRAERGLLHMSGGAPSPEIQDRDALRPVLRSL